MTKRAETVSDVPLQYIPCRAFRHEPRHINDTTTEGLGKRIIEFIRHTRCEVCRTEVFATYSVPDFRVIKRRYFYPDNYQVKGGLSIYDARANYIANFRKAKP